MRRAFQFASAHGPQFLKFGAVGVVNTVVDFTGYLVLTRYANIPFLLANALSWTLAVCCSFTLNKFWTFRSRSVSGIGRQYARFFIVSAIALVLSLAFLYVFVTFFGIHDIIAKVLTIGIVVFWNFFMNKFWTFSERATHEV